MDIEEIKTLTDLMVDNDLSEIMIRDGDKRIVIRRKGAGADQPIVIANPQPPAVPLPPSPAALPTESPAGSSAAGAPAARTDEDAGLELIKSPMVGTFYAATDPESPPFVRVGDRVTPDSVVCVIEAMKVFNDIKAESSGIVEAIEVENAAAVEFGQVLMKIRPG